MISLLQSLMCSKLLHQSDFWFQLLSWVTMHWRRITTITAAAAASRCAAVITVTWASSIGIAPALFTSLTGSATSQALFRCRSGITVFHEHVDILFTRCKLRTLLLDSLLPLCPTLSLRVWFCCLEAPGSWAPVPATVRTFSASMSGAH